MDNKKNIRRKGYDIIPKLLCLFAAFVLWLYVTQVETIDYEETFNGIPVELTNTSVLETESGLHVYSGHGNTANVTVSGRKSDINKYSSDSIRVYADVSGIKEAGRHRVSVVAEAPSGLNVSGLSVSFINVYVDATSSIEVDIKPSISTAYIGNGCELGEVSPEYSLVTVTGPKAVLSKVSHAKVALDLGSVESSVSTIAPLTLVDINDKDIDMRYVQLNRNEVKVTVPVYTTKEVPLSLDYKHNLFNDTNVNVFFEPKTIKIKGDPAELSNIDSVSVGTLDEKSITTDAKLVYKLVLPEGITSPEKVENVKVTVSHIGTTLRSISVNDIDVNGADKIKYELLTKSLAVKIRGTSTEVNKLSEEDITATVNISEYSDSVKGIVTVNASIKLSSEAGKAYVVGEYPVQIRID